MTKPERQTYFSRNCQGTRRAGSARARSVAFAFYSPTRVSPSGLPLSRRFGWNHEPKVQRPRTGAAALHVFTMLCGEILAAAPRPRKPRDLVHPTPVWLEPAFVIIGLRRNPPEWRYRLGVRTEDSQSSNPGSIPGSATSTFPSC